eukprot:jgi/Bigna1/136203/aug1.32_g10911
MLHDDINDDDDNGSDHILCLRLLANRNNKLIDRRSGVELKCYKGHKNWKLRLRSEFVWDNSLIATPSEVRWENIFLEPCNGTFVVFMKLYSKRAKVLLAAAAMDIFGYGGQQENRLRHINNVPILCSITLTNRTWTLHYNMLA